MMTSNEIRSSFLKFFKEKNHKFIRSSPVLPSDDPTLLFTNAGMNQFKPIFLDEINPNYTRVVNTQKCIRVSGKHNDLEEVGVDTFHHTFFEMLGNWSFGDYYKKEAIQWSWELFTEIWKLDKERLWATVYKDDDEAFDLWLEVTDIKPDRVIRCGEKDNFWEMGDTGPCGPCSEIHYYIGKDPEQQLASGVNHSDEYWELWNLVFIQNNRLEDGSLIELPSKHIDTGAGLERVTAVLQGKSSNYDTDLFQPIIKAIEERANSSYNKEPIPHRVIADHIRMLCFSIADGALPSNEGRGYVLRRVLRRASRFGRSIGLEEPFLHNLVPLIIKIMGENFPEINEKKTHIQRVILSEETSFDQTLDRGLIHFQKILDQNDSNQISGEDAFKLYDTFGFPFDLTQLMAKENNLVVDEKGFNECMHQQRKKAKSSGKFKFTSESLDWISVSNGSHSSFIGYDNLTSNSKIIEYSKKYNGEVYLVLDQTPFYAESGGQVSDRGKIIGENINLDVLDVKNKNQVVIHSCRGDFDYSGRDVQCKVDISRRRKARNNHTATHLMHRALKNVLGEHVNQAGSLVHPDYLRFDLTHFEKITQSQIEDIEKIVNNQIIENKRLDISIKSYDEAKKEGAEALFGEKYGDNVRVVKVGDFSKELCGGTHVDRTGDIGMFKIIEESSLSTGVRRLVALTGLGALKEIQKNHFVLQSLQQNLNIPFSEIVSRVITLKNEKKNLEKKIKKQFHQNSGSNIFNDIQKIGDINLIIKKVKVENMLELKSLGDQVFNKLSNGVAILFAEGEEKPMAIIIVAKKLNVLGVFAGDVAKKVGIIMGGGGGGKPHMATAGGKDNSVIEKAISETKDLVEKTLEAL
ncbi:MAG: alanine--tRNA ligase [Candidatus Marinimicrobia bacterium]|nr:alanine--tRNA ligase [Candidatus Neomarinimicrobiota bacterium]